MKVAIDIGHARLTGARGCGQEEHELCGRMAPILERLLQLNGIAADIVDFPEKDNRGDLVETVKTINAGGYDVSVSLHCDASDNPDAHGAHVCYVSEAGRKLAKKVSARLCSYMPGRANKTVRRKDLYILNNTRPVAILVECGFLTNVDDCLTLLEEPEPIIRAIANGIIEWAREKES